MSEFLDELLLLIHFLFNTLGIAPVFLSLDFGDNGGEIGLSSSATATSTSTAGGAGKPTIKTNLSLFTFIERGGI